MREIPLFKVFMSEDVPDSLSQVLRSGYIGQGPKVEEFESQLKKKFSNDYLLTVNSCTSALQLAVYLLKSEGWDDDDEILVTPLTCFATVSSILANNVKLRWVDIDPNSCNICLEDLARKFSPKTRAVLVVHWGGTPVNLAKLKVLQDKYYNLYGKKLHIIEDCAHCWYAEYDDNLGGVGDLVGNSGNFCCFSFQAIKFLTTGDGGMLIVPDAETYKRAKLLRWFGLDRESSSHFRCVQNIKESGFKYGSNDIAATIGIQNLRYMENVVATHKENAKFYNDNLNLVNQVGLLDYSLGSSYWIFTMLVENRSDFIRYMDSCGIMTSPVHARCDKHDCVFEYRSFLPNMDYLGNWHVSIPCGWWVSPEDKEYIVDCIKKGW